MLSPMSVAISVDLRRSRWLQREITGANDLAGAEWASCIDVESVGGWLVGTTLDMVMHLDERRHHICGLSLREQLRSLQVARSGASLMQTVE
jgi:hypothetical protein